MSDCLLTHQRLFDCSPLKLYLSLDIDCPYHLKLQFIFARAINIRMAVNIGYVVSKDILRGSIVVRNFGNFRSFNSRIPTCARRELFIESQPVRTFPCGC